ncbi:putative nucleic acid binding protein [Tripterygium wilfordii]|uniref:Putative nucleic acid binding protein n=1 Tax=Tripterygium wilfordii TaxID=458696 RepID=A0A7J7DY11_TRIWF|nr:protein indeterminate-domain 7-like [Tripterygium wilfordii]KAF5751262.1 putative nucleic acid binding protein [Tripterygium wilfordii]
MSKEEIMMKDWIFYQQQQTVLEENMSNILTSAASGEASVLSETQPVLKRKRNLPGNPDPEAEVIALSPNSLMATNRFVCEICNKGFQRDQNLQLHRRGHNVPWKLKKRINKDVIRKKVYVCPEPSCVHHEPSRALGDLSGIKKHFCRKHGEKKWKCDKCSKKYAVQSDWTAHSKTCGTREYRCDCGTLFSRRDSFITHRAFCDALAEKSTKAPNPLQPFPMKMEQPWLGCPQPASSLGPDPLPTQAHLDFSTSSSARLLLGHQENLTSNPRMGPTELSPYHQSLSSSSPSSLMSATALLQKAAQMGATMSSKSHVQQAISHVSAESGNNNTAGFGLNLSSSDDHEQQQTSWFVQGLISNDKAAATTMNIPFSSGTGFQGTTTTTTTNSTAFDEAFGGIFNGKSGSSTDKDSDESPSTRDFLGLRPLSHTDILSITDFGNCFNTTHQQQKY